MKITLRHFNNGLSLVVIGLCLYVIIAPLWPQLAYQVQQAPPLVKAEEKGEEVIPEDDTLVIPRMKLQQKILEGGEWLIHKGVWHQSDTGAPDTGSNMVLSGHRFTYGGPAVFYHLDKVRLGDRIIVYWQKQKYQYEVKSIREVPPTAAEVIAPTENHQLTIYTCTPLVTAKNRLIVQAEPIGANE